MKKFLAVFFVLALAGGVFAGYVMETRVDVDIYSDGSGFAWGSLSSARNADNDVEYIGCVIME